MGSQFIYSIFIFQKGDKYSKISTLKNLLWACKIKIKLFIYFFRGGDLGINIYSISGINLHQRVPLDIGRGVNWIGYSLRSLQNRL